MKQIPNRRFPGKSEVPPRAGRLEPGSGIPVLFNVRRCNTAVSPGEVWISPIDVGMRTAHTTTPMHLIHGIQLARSSRPPEDQVVIASERRQFLKRRWRGLAADGTEFGFDLESRLTDGCVVFQTPEKDYIVRQLPESVYELPLESPAQAALVAWKVGNLHLPAQILEHSIRVLHDDAMTQLLGREAWPHTTPEVIFTPMKVMAHS